MHVVGSAVLATAPSESSAEFGHPPRVGGTTGPRALAALSGGADFPYANQPSPPPPYRRPVDLVVPAVSVVGGA